MERIICRIVASVGTPPAYRKSLVPHLGVMHDSRDSEAKATACRTAEVSLPARIHEVWGQNGRWTLVVGRYTREELVQRRNEGDALYARREIGRDEIFLQRKRPGKAQFWNMLYTDVVGGIIEARTC